MPDTLQAGTCLFPPFQISCDNVVKFNQSQPSTHLTHVAFLQFLTPGQYGLCFSYLVSGLLPLRSHKRQVTFSGPFLEVPSHKITLEIGQNHLSIEAQCDYHNKEPLLAANNEDVTTFKKP